MDDTKIPRPFRIEPLCLLPCSLARTGLVARPCVAFLHSDNHAAGAGAGSGDGPGDEPAALVERERPDLVLVAADAAGPDAGVPGWVAALDAIRSTAPDVAVMVVGGPADEHRVAGLALERGARGRGRAVIRALLVLRMRRRRRGS